MLERPFNEVLESGEPDFPFCLCWANHSWNSVWQGAANRTLIEQQYGGMQDHAEHFDFLLRAFRDPRYITVEGRPVFVVYKPDDIPEVQRVTEFWRQRAHEAGLSGLHLVGVSHFNERWSPVERGFDACMMQKLPPMNGRVPWKYLDAKGKLLLARRRNKVSIYTYREIRSFLLPTRRAAFLDYPCVLPNWDNTPRAGMDGLVFHESTPELFAEHIRDALTKVADNSVEERILFLKAWNEWAEGNYVEPDHRFGRGYLEVIRDEILQGMVGGAAQGQPMARV